MATLVNNHQQAGITSPANGDDLDADALRLQVNTLRVGPNAHDADGGLHFQSGTQASRPAAAAGNAGWKWVDSDTQRAYISDGAAWLELAYLPVAGGSITGAVNAANAVTVKRATGLPGVAVAVTGDAFARVELDTDGVVRWGSGAVATDTTLYRTGAAALASNADFTVGKVTSTTLIAGADPGGTEPFRTNGNGRFGGGLVTVVGGAGSAQLTLSNTSRNWAVLTYAAGQFSITDNTAGQDRVVIDSAGNVAVGVSVAAPVFRTASGSVSAVNSGSSITPYTIAAAGLYLVHAYSPNQFQTVQGYAFISATGAGFSVLASAGNGVYAFAMSGSLVQITQTSGAQQTVAWTVTRLS